MNVHQFEEEDLVEDEVVLEPSVIWMDHKRHTRQVVEESRGKTRLQVKILTRLLLNGDGKRPRVDNETAPSATSSVFPFFTRHLPFLRVTATVLDLWIQMMRTCPSVQSQSVVG